MTRSIVYALYYVANNIIWYHYVLTQYFRGFIVWKRQQEYKLVLVFIGIGVYFFYVGVKNDLVIFFGSKLTLALVWRSKLTGVLCADRIWLGFCVGVQNDLGLVFGSKLASFMWGIELDLM